MKKLLFLLIIPISLSFFFYFQYPKTIPAFKGTLFTPEELSHYKGITTEKIYLSILGRVFDVTEGKKNYGPGGSYHFFAGKDASRAFVIGKFTEENLIAEISDLSTQQIGDLNKWVMFFEEKYPEIGRLKGHFFDIDGVESDKYRDFQLKLKGSSLEEEKAKEFAVKYPRCNSKWDIDSGGEVCCNSETAKSNGVERNWVGVPRKYYPKIGGRNFDCICVEIGEAIEKPELFKKYDNCEEKSETCKY